MAEREKQDREEQRKVMESHVRVRSAGGDEPTSGYIRKAADFADSLERLHADTGKRSFILEISVGPRALRQALLTEAGSADAEVRIKHYIFDELRHRLSPADFALFEGSGLDIHDELARQRIMQTLDALIMRAGARFGPSIFIWRTVLGRVVDWSLEPAKCRQRWMRLASQLVIAQRAMTGDGHGPIDDWWVRSQGQLLEEVKKLKEVMNERSSGGQSPHPDHTLMDLTTDVMTSFPDLFPKLFELGNNFLFFVAVEPQEMQTLLAGELTPAQFRDEMIGWILKRKPEAARQQISGLHSTPRETNRS